MHDGPGTPTSRWRHFFWDGVLPESLGLCFVIIILSGFAGTYLVAEYLWKQQVVGAQRAETEALAQTLAAALGTVAADEQETGATMLQACGTALEQWRGVHVRALRWTAPDGVLRFSWPPRVPLVAGVPTGTTPDAGAARSSVVTKADVHSRGGAAFGTLEVETTGGVAGARAFVLWNWGIAAAVTLVVFVGFYHRLRRHLRPMVAIERNLHSYASGVEQELLTLTLSESLGVPARGWNRLIEQLVDLQRRLQAAPAAGAAQNILERFESATFRRLVDRLPHGVLWVGENQCITYANAAGAAILGRPDGLVGAALAEVVDNPAVVQTAVAARARAASGLSVDHTRGSGEQESTLRFRAVALADQAGGGDVLITIEDISQLRESQRARDNFLYHVTHELRTPLTNIHAYAETLTKPGFDDEQTRKECYNVLISETQRLARLVEDILSISQMEVGTARFDVGDVDLLRLLRQMVQDNLGAADEKRIDLTLSLPPKVPKIRGDKQRLCVLLNNLIGNAIKYTREGGKVQVALEVAENCVRIGVTDTGIGIAPADQAHVFEKFYRAADDAVQAITGTGLGLALAQEVARLHGGEIHLQSELGQGSTFTVELPMPAAEHGPLAREPAEVTTR
jgi:signal transduction histidine kinase